MLGPPAAGYPRPEGPLPQDQKLAQWAGAVHQIHSGAKAFTHPDARQRRRVQQQLERELLAHCRPFLEDQAAVQSTCAGVSRSSSKFIKELFVFVAQPAVPSDNNAAERSLRPLVVSRKISGGTRSAQGTDSKLTLASLFGTWRAQGLDPLQSCQLLLTSPQL